MKISGMKVDLMHAGDDVLEGIPGRWFTFARKPGFASSLTWYKNKREARQAAIDLGSELGVEVLIGRAAFEVHASIEVTGFKMEAE